MASPPSVSTNTTDTSAGSLVLHTSNDYFSIDDILASQQRVPCTFELPVYRLGYLNPNSTDEHLEVGTKMDLPFWLARALCSRRRKIVAVEPPKAYREAQREIINADASVVDLQKLGPYYYSLGMKLLCFEEIERAALAISLLEVSKGFLLLLLLVLVCLQVLDMTAWVLQTFLRRFRGIMDSSQHAFRQDINTMCSRLDEQERELFHIGQLAVTELENWERGKGSRITMSEVIQNNKKRKRELEE